MIYMLDTNILIYLLKNKPISVAERINQLDPLDELCMSFITYAELLKGANNSSKKLHVMHQLERLIQQVPVLYPDQVNICQHYAEQFNQLKAAGTPIGGNDLWIACHALSVGATLVTHNTKEFVRVVGLSLDDWVANDEISIF